MFYHSLVSDWNHGNAHFLRGVSAELMARGHSVTVYEPKDGWSLKNLVSEHGEKPIRDFEARFPLLKSTSYDSALINLDTVLDDADLVLVHEWNEPRLIRKIGERRAAGGDFILLFHDTHHRSLTEGNTFGTLGLDKYDGVLAYGQVIRDRYLSKGWAASAWVWHEAADTRIFRPIPDVARDLDLIWVGNWGDEERTAELLEFLVEPARSLGIRGRAYGVRYPLEGTAAMNSAGLEYRGWLPNYEVPKVFARSKATVHIPRRPYVEILRGIPTIRPFEALACGIPLVCSPWDDSEGLFSPGEDFLVARNGREMTMHLRDLMEDRQMAEELASRGMCTVLSKHTCRHRVDELLQIYRFLTKSDNTSISAN